MMRSLELRGIMIRTGFAGVKFGWSAYIVPFLFVTVLVVLRAAWTWRPSVAPAQLGGERRQVGTGDAAIERSDPVAAPQEHPHQVVPDVSRTADHEDPLHGGKS